MFSSLEQPEQTIGRIQYKLATSGYTNIRHGYGCGRIGSLLRIRSGTKLRFDPVRRVTTIRVFAEIGSRWERGERSLRSNARHSSVGANLSMSCCWPDLCKPSFYFPLVSVPRGPACVRLFAYFSLGINGSFVGLVFLPERRFHPHFRCSPAVTSSSIYVCCRRSLVNTSGAVYVPRPRGEQDASAV